MSSRRVERLNEQLKREITEILRFEVKDPRVGLATVTAVRVSADLSFARVFVLPTDDEEDSRILDGLRAATPFIRTELGQRLRLRRVPELRFELDESIEHALRIERLLQEVLPKDEGEAASADPEAPNGGHEPDDEGTESRDVG